MSHLFAAVTILPESPLLRLLLVAVGLVLSGAGAITALLDFAERRADRYVDRMNLGGTGFPLDGDE